MLQLDDAALPSQVPRLRWPHDVIVPRSQTPLDVAEHPETSEPTSNRLARKRSPGEAVWDGMSIPALADRPTYVGTVLATQGVRLRVLKAGSDVVRGGAEQSRLRSYPCIGEE